MKVKLLNRLFLLGLLTLGVSGCGGSSENQEKPLDLIKVNNEGHFVAVGSKLILDVTLDSSIKNSGLTYSSSDESIATVDKYGEVKGIKEGEATITISSKSEEVYSVYFPIKVLDNFEELIASSTIAESIEFDFYDVSSDKVTLKEYHQPEYFYYESDEKVEGYGISGNGKAVKFNVNNGEVKVDENAYYDLEKGISYRYLSNFYELCNETATTLLSYVSIDELDNKPISTKEGISYELNKGDFSSDNETKYYEFLNSYYFNFIAGNLEATRDNYLQVNLVQSEDDSYFVELVDDNSLVKYKVKITNIGTLEENSKITKALSDSDPKSIPESYKKSDIIESLNTFKNYKEGLRIIDDETSSDKGYSAYYINNSYVYIDYSNYTYEDTSGAQKTIKNDSESGLLVKTFASGNAYLFTFVIYDNVAKSVVGYDENMAFDSSRYEIKILEGEDSSGNSYTSKFDAGENLSEVFLEDDVLDSFYNLSTLSSANFDTTTFFKSSVVYSNSNEIFENCEETYVTDDLFNVAQGFSTDELIQYISAGYMANSFAISIHSKGNSGSTFNYKDDAIGFTKIYKSMTSSSIYSKPMVNFDSFGGATLKNDFDDAIKACIESLTEPTNIE